MTPQVRIPGTPGAQFSTRPARGSGPRGAVFGIMRSLRLSAACAAAGALMVVGGLAGGGSVSPEVDAPLAKVAQALPVTQSPAAPRPVEPQPAQKPQQAQKAQKPPCTGARTIHPAEPGYRPWVDDDHGRDACER